MLNPLLDHFWDSRASIEEEAEANGWSERSQSRRMEAAVAAIDLTEEIVVLDWGCGTGRLADFLPYDAHYLGVDANAAMLERARAERPDHHFVSTEEFVVSPSQEPIRFGYVFALGVWNVKPWQKPDTFAELERLWSLTEKALIVSLLRTTGRDNSLTYDPLEVAAWAASLEASGWTLTTNHLPNDILVSVHR